MSRREKIIVHPAEEFVQGPLFHPKWSAQDPPRNFSVWYSLLSRALRRVPGQSTTCVRQSSATCCSLGMSHRLRELNRTNLPREAIAAGAFGNRPDKGRVRCSPFKWTRTPKCSKPFVGGPVLLHNLNEKGVLVLDLDDH